MRITYPSVLNITMWLSTRVIPEEITELFSLSVLNCSLFQIKRLEGLLSMCKENIQGNKERYGQMNADRERLQKELEQKTAELERVQVRAIMFLFLTILR